MNPVRRSRHPFVRLRLWARRYGLERKLAFVLAVVAGVSGIATVAALSGTTPAEMEPTAIVTLLYADIVLLLLLGLFVVRRLAAVWVARRRGLAGSRLHTRLVVLFGLVAVTPAILVAVFASIFLNFGLDAWFNQRVRTAIEESRAVAQAYLTEHRQGIRADLLAMASDINRELPDVARNPLVFSQMVSALAQLREVGEAIVVDGAGQVLARAPFSFSLEFDMANREVIAQARARETVLITRGDVDRVRAIARLDGLPEAYLIVGRQVAPRVLSHIALTERVVAQYQAMEQRRQGIQFTFVMIFVVAALLLLLAAVWVGLLLANQLAHPISALISAAERVRKGDLAARVEASGSADEIGLLSRAFNRMTDQIETQQRSLIDANRQLDERRRFTETVLEGVSAGVIGLDRDGVITLPNRSAADLLQFDLVQHAGRPLAEVVPEMAPLLEAARGKPERVHHGEVQRSLAGRTQTLTVTLAAERLAGEVVGFVLTFDDVTELLSAQRTAAWADVARRIAHEIKNPLTPIQLSAERLKRKYLKEIVSDPATFATCTDTIVRQVEEIGRMVDEFSAFARMPQAELRTENLVEICRQAVFLERNRHAGTAFETAFGDRPLAVRCDRQQIGRALTNVLKNAAEAIETRRSAAGGEFAGRIRVALAETETPQGRRIEIAVEDNGIGLPAAGRDRLTEPYVTTREKGTGLGLAIVKKIMEDHGGELRLEDGGAGGARVRLILPAGEARAAQAPGTAAEAAGGAAAPLGTGTLGHGA